MRRISERVERLENRKPDKNYLVVGPDETDEQAIEDWRRRHPRGTIIRIEYRSLEYDDIGA